MRRGEYFSDGERVACDRGFKGYGPQVCSFNDCHGDADKEYYNVAFREVRRLIENAFGRVQMWFPILGNQKAYWNYDLETLDLAIGAATKLHNWMLRKRRISYNPEDNVNNHERDVY